MHSTNVSVPSNDLGPLNPPASGYIKDMNVLGFDSEAWYLTVLQPGRPDESIKLFAGVSGAVGREAAAIGSKACSFVAVAEFNLRAFGCKVHDISNLRTG
jgi:hypothetical protein